MTLVIMTACLQLMLNTKLPALTSISPAASLFDARNLSVILEHFATYFFIFNYFSFLLSLFAVHHFQHNENRIECG